MKVHLSFDWCDQKAITQLSICLLRAFEDEGKTRLGVVECAKHELLQPFNVLQEKEGE